MNARQQYESMSRQSVPGSNGPLSRIRERTPMVRDVIIPNNYHRGEMSNGQENYNNGMHIDAMDTYQRGAQNVAQPLRGHAPPVNTVQPKPFYQTSYPSQGPPPPPMQQQQSRSTQYYQQNGPYTPHQNAPTAPYQQQHIQNGQGNLQSNLQSNLQNGPFSHQGQVQNQYRGSPPSPQPTPHQPLRNSAPPVQHQKVNGPFNGPSPAEWSGYNNTRQSVGQDMANRSGMANLSTWQPTNNNQPTHAAEPEPYQMIGGGNSPYTIGDL